MVVNEKQLSDVNIEGKNNQSPQSHWPRGGGGGGGGANPSDSVLFFETMHLCTSSVLPEFLLMVLLLVLKRNDIRRPFPERSFLQRRGWIQAS